MSSSSFPRYLHSQGLDFGMSNQVLSAIAQRTDQDEPCGALLDDPDLAGIGLVPAHLLTLRRAYRRYQASRQTLPAAEQWATRQVAGQQDRRALVGIFSAVLASTLKKGRLRLHPIQAEASPGKPIAHTESCADIPPHRWFAAARKVAAGRLWLEVCPPPAEPAQSLGALSSPAQTEDLSRAIGKAVLDSIRARAEREVVAATAGALYALLSRPAIKGCVAGVALDRQQAFVHLLGGPNDGEHTEIRLTDLPALSAWLKKRRPEQVGVACLAARISSSLLIQSLTVQGLSVELVREAGLMKQARQEQQNIKAAAAATVASRLRDPISGYAGLEADELGLGEYLDQVDPTRLHAALADARAVACWDRTNGKKSRPVARGQDLRPMLREWSDLKPGMELTGSIANLTHFGAFVELGLGSQGLIHLSELADHFVRHPSEVVQVGQRVRVRVLEIDNQQKRLSLSLRKQDRGQGKSSASRRSEAMQNLDQLFKK